MKLEPTEEQLEAATLAMMRYTNSPTHDAAKGRARELARVALQAAYSLPNALPYIGAQLDARAERRCVFSADGKHEWDIPHCVQCGYGVDI